MVYNAKFEVLTCSLSGIPVRIVLNKRELNPVFDSPQLIAVSGLRIKQKDTDVVTEPINGSELSITFISDSNFNSGLLYTEDERDWRIDIFFNGDLFWSGFVLPEGFSEPYDDGRYDIALKATDTLGNLKNVAYQDVSLYKGFDTDKNIIVKCLSKTGLTLPIVFGINVFESHMNLSLPPMEQSSINQDRFVDSSSKSFSCHEVLRSILERYGAKLCQAKGCWYIVNTLEATKGNIPAWKYDYTGASMGQLTIDDIITAGATTDEAPIIDRTHDISKAKAFKSSMSYYQFGFVKNAITNGDFNSVESGFFPGWQKVNDVNAGVADSTETDQSTGNMVVTGHSLIVFAADTGAGQMVRSTNPIQVRANEKVTINFELVVYNLGAPINDYELQLVITDNSGRYYSKDGWQNFGVPYGIKLNGADIASNKIFSVNFEIPAGSTDYQLTFAFAQVYRKSGNNYSPRETHFDNLNINVSVADAVLTPAVGEYLRLTQPKNLTYSGDAVLLLHGDEASNLRTSQILVGANPTSQWSRVGFGLNESKPLLYLVADSILRLNSRPKNIVDAKFASKEIISPISLFQINQITGNYLVLSGEFDLLNEEYKLVLFEGINDEVNIITPYETGTDTGNLKDKTGTSIGQPSGVNNPPSPNTSPNSGLVSRLSEENGYLLIDNLKINAGYSDFALNANHSNLSDYATNANHANIADLATRALRADLADYALDSDKWDGAQFSDYLNQPVKNTSDVRHKSLSSLAFVSGFTGYGFQIDENGNATFDNLTVRKQMNVYELTVNKINATNGALAVTDTIKLDLVTNPGAGQYNCYIDTVNGTILIPFQVNDLIRCQVWNGTGIKYYFAKVTYINPDASAFSMTIIDGAGIPAAGDTVVRFGSTSNTNRQGLLYLTASDTNAPYLDVLDGVNSSDLSGKTKVRLGKLNGIVDADFGSLSGYGLYGENVYLTNGRFKGEINVTGGNAATQIFAQGVANNAGNNAFLAAQNYADSVSTSKANIAQLTAISSASADATAKANAAQSAAVSASTSLVNSIQVGGVNYFSKNQVINDLGNNPIIIKEPTINGFRLIGRQNQSCNARMQNVINSNGFWTVSFTGYNNSTAGFYLELAGHSAGLVTITPTPTKYSFTFNVTNYGTFGYAFLDFYDLQWIDYSFKDFKIEKGQKATDWSPSIEDTNALIQTAQNAANAATISYNNLTANLKNTAFQDIEQWAIGGQFLVNGGKVNTNLLDAGAIRANIINAGYIESLELVSKSIKTSNEDKRVEILASENNIRIIKSGIDLIALDDDTAIERVRLDGTIEYGAGISVNSISGLKKSTLSASGLNVYYNGNSRHTIGVAPLSDLGYVKLDVEGGFQINNIQYSGGSPATISRKVIAQEINVEGFSGIVLGLI